jgi:GT2 family glycosyltransferase
MATPHVTIWIPSYNYGRYLSDAVDSVLEQDFEDFELLIFDDGSTDDSYEIAQGYAERDVRVRVLQHPGRQNRGVAATIIAAFAGSRGEFVAGLAADDMLLPGSLARRIEALEADPQLSFVYGLIEMVDDAGNRTGVLVGTPPDVLRSIDATEDRLAALLLHNYIPGHSVLVRRVNVELVGGFSDSLLYSDWELWIKLLARGRAGFVPHPPVAGHRSHSMSMSLAATSAENFSRRLEVFRSIDDAVEEIGGRLAEKRMRALVRLQRAWHAFRVEERHEAEATLRAAFDADPTLASASDWLLWWIGPRQATAVTEWIADALAECNADPEAVIARGLRAGHFGCWFLHTIGFRLTQATRLSLQWGIIANELELSGRGQHLAAFTACLRRAVREPTLFRQRWLLKTLLSTAGAWRTALRLRRLMRRNESYY